MFKLNSQLFQCQVDECRGGDRIASHAGLECKLNFGGGWDPVSGFFCCEACLNFEMVNASSVSIETGPSTQLYFTWEPRSIVLSELSGGGEPDGYIAPAVQVGWAQADTQLRYYNLDASLRDRIEQHKTDIVSSGGKVYTDVLGAILADHVCHGCRRDWMDQWRLSPGRPSYIELADLKRLQGSAR